MDRGVGGYRDMHEEIDDEQLLVMELEKTTFLELFLEAFGQLLAPFVASSGTVGSPMEPQRRKGGAAGAFVDVIVCR